MKAAGKIYIILLTALLVACSGRQSGTTDTVIHNHEADNTARANAWVDSIYKTMSREERLAQMLMPAVFARTDAPTLNTIRHYAEDLKVGGILLLKGDSESAAAIADTLENIRDRLPQSPGFFLSIDAENGLGMRLKDAPVFPWNSETDPTADEQIFYDYGREIGRESRILGINMVLGPVVDINRKEMASSGIMKYRSLGSDPERVASLGKAYTFGLESQGVAAVPKHFPGHGPTTSDSHDRLPVISTPYEEIYEVDLLPFKAVVERGVSGIMIGHLYVEALDEDRRPASFSEMVIDGLLRMVMGYKGLVLIDAVNMAGARGYTGADAIIAGADIIIAPFDTKKELQHMVEAMDDGRLPEQLVEKSCKRILFQKYMQEIPTHSRKRENPEDTQIIERLYQEAPDIINRLSGF